MVGKRGNFFIPSSRVLLWSGATFIMLSVAAAAERQCYWCGPLAEQVHRSRRAPPCDVPTEHVTTCEPGLMHCAIVATAPPHVESRFCVKLYQDECYPLFCNSTKTWKMTCPCRGNLCNGNNTEREDQAFAILTKLVAKSQNVRIKKRAVSNLATSKEERTIIITNMTELQLNRTNDDTNGIGESDTMIVVTSTIRGDSIKEEPSTDNPTKKTIKEEEPSTDKPTKKTLKENTISEIVDDSQQSQLDINHSIENITTQNFPDDESTTSMPKADTNVKIDAPTISEKTNAILTTVTNEATHIVKEIETTKMAEIVQVTSTAKETEMTKADAIKERTTPMVKKNVVIPSEQLPTAEALQQNASPTPTNSKMTEDIKVESTEFIPTVETENNTTVRPKSGAANISPIPTHFYLIVLITYFATN